MAQILARHQSLVAWLYLSEGTFSAPHDAGHWTSAREGQSLPEIAANNKQKLILHGTESIEK